MEPLRGGQLTNPGDAIQTVWNKATAKRSPVEWALDWLWNQPEVSVVLSGMSTLEQVEQNLQYADQSSPQMLNPDEVQLVEQVRIAYNSLIQINCTACKYCMPCPNGVAIPSLFGTINEASMYGTWKQKKRYYQHLLKEGKAVEVCTQCGVCEEKCPRTPENP